MLRMLFLDVSKRVRQLWLPVGVVWRALCQDGQLIELLAQMHRAIWYSARGTAFLIKQVVSITKERGIACE